METSEVRKVSAYKLKGFTVKLKEKCLSTVTLQMLAIDTFINFKTMEQQQV